MAKVKSDSKKINFGKRKRGKAQKRTKLPRSRSLKLVK